MPYNIILQSKNYNPKQTRKLEIENTYKKTESLIIEDPESQESQTEVFKKPTRKEKLDEINKGTKIVCDHRLIKSFIEREKIIKNPIHFDEPDKHCPLIKNSCCTKMEIRHLYSKYNSNIYKLKNLFLSLYETFKIYADDYDFLRSLLMELTEEDEECAQTTKKEVLNFLRINMMNYERKKNLIDHFFQFTVGYQTGFMCSMCDNNYNKFFENHDGILKIIYNDASCDRVYREKILMSNIQFFNINLGKVVSALHCSIKKSPGSFQYLREITLRKKISDFKYCLSIFNAKVNFLSESCRDLCKKGFNLNYVGNIDNLFKLSNKMKYFYRNFILKKKDTFYHYSKYDKRNEVIMLKTVVGGNYNLEDRILRISLVDGLQFYSNRMTLNDKISLFESIGIEMFIFGITSLILLF